MSEPVAAVERVLGRRHWCRPSLNPADVPLAMPPTSSVVAVAAAQDVVAQAADELVAASAAFEHVGAVSGARRRC